MNSPPNVAERFTGCLLAGALGDAIGSRFEGQSPTLEFVIPADLRVSDDTQLTIATCESIIETRSVNPESIAGHFLHWFRQRRITGIGGSTLKSLTELAAGGHWAMVGATGERAAGNGAAMRIAPLAFVLDPDQEKSRQTIRDVCRITHRNDEAYCGALAMVRAIQHAIGGNPLDSQLVNFVAKSIPDSRVRDRLKLADDSRLSVAEYASRFPSSGFVADAVPLAILAASQSTDLPVGIRQMVQCGGDTDTVASMFGQIYGATHGTACLPMNIVDRIDEVSLVKTTVANFVRIMVAK